MALSTLKSSSSSSSRSAQFLSGATRALPSDPATSRALPSDPAIARALPSDSSDPATAIAQCSSRKVAVAELQDGTALPLLAREHCKSFLKILGSPDRLAPARRITIGTACTGSAADILSFHALEQAFQDHVPSFEVAYLFNCEATGFKRKWGKALHGACAGTSPAPPCCWFKDINSLHEGTASCCQHDEVKGCTVQAVDIFVCATSCKDFSKANPHKHTKPGGESARTLSGMNSFLNMFRPPLFLFENVDSIDDSSPASGQAGGGSDMDIALSKWASIGYECQRVVVNSAEFGIPASRRRMLVIGIQTEANAAFDFSQRPLSTVFSTLRSLIRLCQRTHSCASEVLLPSDHPAVQLELARRQQIRVSASGLTVCGAYNIKKAMETADQRGVQWGSFGPPAAMKADVWFNTFTKQQQDAAVFR